MTAGTASRARYAGPPVRFASRVLVSLLAGLFASACTSPVHDQDAHAGGTTVPVVAWTLVPGGGPFGALNNGTGGAHYPQLVVYHDRIYDTWYEEAGGGTRIRVAVLEETDAGSTWRPVDGNPSGLNRDPSRDALWSRLVVHDDTLIAYWYERTAAGPWTIRVAAYGGNDGAPSWTYLDGDEANGLTAPGSSGADYASFASYDGTLYAAWRSTNGSAYQIRVARFNGDASDPAWSLVDRGTHGINHDTTADAYYPKLHVHDGRLYAAWYERNGIARQLRVAVYNGDPAQPAWSSVDGGGHDGINYDHEAGARGPQLLTHAGWLFAVWYEEDVATGGTVRVARYNGNDIAPAWTFVDGGTARGLDRGDGTNAWWARAVSYDGYLVVAWSENDAGTYRIRASAYDATTGFWHHVDPHAGLNSDPIATAEYPHLVSAGERVYLSWSERTDGVFRIFVREGLRSPTPPRWRAAH